MIKEMQSSQARQCSLLVRQTETAHMAMQTPYRDQHGPSEAVSCHFCEGSALFVITPDGRLVCDECAATVGRWAARPEMRRF